MKNICILTVPRSASTYYQRYLSVKYNLYDCSEEFENININHPYIVKCMLSELLKNPWKQSILNECEVHLLLPRKDKVDQILSNIIPWYKNDIENKYVECWGVTADCTREDVINYFENMKVPHSFVEEKINFIILQMIAIEHWKTYDKKISYEQVLNLPKIEWDMNWDHQIFRSKMDKLKYLEEPEKSLKLVEDTCSLLT